MQCSEVMVISHISVRSCCILWLSLTHCVAPHHWNWPIRLSHLVMCVMSMHTYILIDANMTTYWSNVVWVCVCGLSCGWCSGMECDPGSLPGPVWIKSQNRLIDPPSDDHCGTKSFHYTSIPSQTTDFNISIWKHLILWPNMMSTGGVQ